MKGSSRVSTALKNKKFIILSIAIIIFALMGAYLLKLSFAQTAVESTTGCAGVLVPAGTDIQAAISANASGATFCLGSGTHRITKALSPKAGNTFWGETGAILSGAKVVTGWSPSGQTWVVSGVLPADYTEGFAPCENETLNTCKKAEQVFVNSTQLTKVMDIASVKTGTFFADYVNNKLYIGTDPTAKTVELSSTRNAIYSGAANITIKKLIIEKFASLSQHAAVESINNATALNWVIDSNEFRNNHAAGVKVFGNGTKVTKNKFHHNGQTGLAVYKSANVVVDGNEASNNNTDGFWINDGENGGMKLTNTTSATVTNNYVHDNKGLGIWFDIDNKNAVITNNFVSNNGSDGLRYEISFDANISNNTFVKNGYARGRGTSTSLGSGGGITVNTSSNVTIANNVIYDNDKAVAAIKSNRGTSPGYGVAWDLTNLKVYSNTITIKQGLHGLIQYVGDTSYYTSKGNSFYNNKYHLASLSGTYYYWQNASQNKDKWVSYGQDTAGTFDTVIPSEPVAPSSGQVTPPPADTTAPTTPSNLALISNAYNSVKISWGASTDATGVVGYQVFRDGVLLSTVSGTVLSYADTTVSAASTYGYQIRAVDAANNQSAFSDNLAITTPNIPDTSAPSAPANFSAVATAYNKVVLTWQASTDNVGVAGYYIVRGGSTIATTTGTTFTDSTVTASTQYSYQVIARDVAGNTATSSVATVTTPNVPDTSAPSVPQNVATQAISSSQINVTWQASTDNIGVANYKIYRNSTLVATVASSSLSYGNTNLSANTSYSYTVAACDVAGNCSAQSAASTVTTLTAQTTGSLIGNVKNQSGGAVNRVKIRINNGTNSYSSFTNSTGTYSFAVLVQGNYSATYSAKSYVPQTASVIITGGNQTVNNIILNKR